MRLINNNNNNNTVEYEVNLVTFSPLTSRISVIIVIFVSDLNLLCLSKCINISPSHLIGSTSI